MGKISPSRSATQRELRQREAGPLLEQLFARLDAERAALRPSSQLAKAVQYTLSWLAVQVESPGLIL